MQWQVDYESRSAFVPHSEEPEIPEKVEQKEIYRKASIEHAEELLLYVK